VLKEFFGAFVKFLARNSKDGDVVGILSCFWNSFGEFHLDFISIYPKN
jgi:hypothetical protein